MQAISDEQMIERLGMKIDALGTRLEGKIGSVETKLEGKIDRLDAKIDSVETKLEGKIDTARREGREDHRVLLALLFTIIVAMIFGFAGIIFAAL